MPGTRSAPSDNPFAGLSARVSQELSRLTTSGVTLAGFDDELALTVTSARLFSELQEFGRHPNSATLPQLVDLDRRITAHTERDSDFMRLMDGNLTRAHLCAMTERLLSCPLRIGPEERHAVILEGSPIQGLKTVLAKLQDVIPSTHQIGIRGGTTEEGLGWLSAGPAGDPRVSDSVYTRRTGSNIPIFDITAAAQTRGSALLTVVDDALRYSRGSNLAQISRNYLREHLEREPTRDEVKDFLGTIELCASGTRGTVMVFSDCAAAYSPTFHRRDPDWGKGSYKFAVGMTPGTRNIRAIMPTPEYHETFLPGSFAVIVTPQLLALSQGAKTALFEAAFRDMDYDKFSSILRRANVVAA